MKISARNILKGKVTEVKKGQVAAIVKIGLSTGEVVSSIITNESAERLGLQEGKEAFAIIKASSVMIAKELSMAQLSARNILKGRITKIKEGMVMAEVVLDLGGGNSIASTISDESVQRMGLKEGDEACAVVKATSVMVGVE
ncbi:MAG: TOBE domain-containing protein [Nitrospirales bacterium]|nr:TOBE domain-containing protein [Nitrospirales bacterium]